MKHKIPTLLAALVALPLVSVAQTPPAQTALIERSATIEAINHTTREVTLKNKAGDLETIVAGPEVKRFAELKVGDTITFRYYESMAYSIRKPGEAASAPSGDPKLVRGTGPKPGGTLSQQATATVTIKAVDPKVPSVTVLTADGHVASFKVENVKLLDGLKAGDKVDVTYTEAIMVTVK